MTATKATTTEATIVHVDKTTGATTTTARTTTSPGQMLQEMVNSVSTANL